MRKNNHIQFPFITSRFIMTEQQILFKLTALCARGEHCLHDMRQKMLRWQVEENMQERILRYLVSEKYIDEERFARFFINDKIKYNHWGVKKVEQALYMKQIPREVYAPLLSEVEDDSYEDILLPVLQTKLRTLLKSYNPEEGLDADTLDYNTRAKLIRFAMQRGFTYDQIDRCINRL